MFRAAGAEWREPGCSMCLGMNGDIGRPGQLIVSTSNRNFEGRQGPGVRTVLASPWSPPRPRWPAASPTRATTPRRRLHETRAASSPVFVIPAQVGILLILSGAGTAQWIPACAGMTSDPSVIAQGINMRPEVA